MPKPYLFCRVIGDPSGKIIHIKISNLKPVGKLRNLILEKRFLHEKNFFSACDLTLWNTSVEGKQETL